LFIARIDGSITATAKHESLRGFRLLVGQRIEADGSPSGEPQVLVDTYGARAGSTVLVTSDGELARKVLRDNRTPTRMMVVGIVDGPVPRRSA
jgi:microcompartment protein CcmK/EutM